MEFHLQIGMTGTKQSIVNNTNTAKTYGSGELEVFATPAMVGLMEGAAMNAVHSSLPEGFGTVGTELQVKHVAATPLEMKVEARAELIAINGKRLSFKVEAYDEVGLIGEGTHERYIVEEEKFLSRVKNKGKE